MSSMRAREAFATEIAPNAGWAVIAKFPAGVEAPGIEFDVYLGEGRDTISIGWTEQETAAFVAINGKRVTGALGLIEARKHMEAHPVAVDA